jgi:IS30 family transposase
MSARPPATRIVRRVTPAEDARIEALRVQGRSLAEIARALGRGKSTIQVRLLLLARRAEHPAA